MESFQAAGRDEIPGVKVNHWETMGVTVTEVIIEDEDAGKQIGKSAGNYLTLGGLDTGGFWRFFPCLLFDVQVYSYALDPLDIGLMANPPTALSLALIRTSIPLGA